MTVASSSSPTRSRTWTTAESKPSNPGPATPGNSLRKWRRPPRHTRERRQVREHLKFQITAVRLNVVQYELVTTALFAIMVVSPEECRKIGLSRTELMPEMCRFSGGFLLSLERSPNINP